MSNKAPRASKYPYNSYEYNMETYHLECFSRLIKMFKKPEFKVYTEGFYNRTKNCVSVVRLSATDPGKVLCRLLICIEPENDMYKIVWTTNKFYKQYITKEQYDLLIDVINKWDPKMKMYTVDKEKVDKYIEEFEPVKSMILQEDADMYPGCYAKYFDKDLNMVSLESSDYAVTDNFLIRINELAYYPEDSEFTHYYDLLEEKVKNNEVL